VAETERQVERHLDEHLAQVPAEDARTHAVLEQMRADESGTPPGGRGGAAALPAPIRDAMRLTAKIMTTAVYRL